MIIWLDAQLAPSLAAWMQTTLNVQSQALREIGLHEAADKEIFESAREAGAVIMTKDADFVKLYQRFGAPPQVLWLTCGNTSNEHLRNVLKDALPSAIKLLETGEGLIEITDRK